MEIPGLGPVVADADYGWYRSTPRPVPVLGGTTCEILVEGYDDDLRTDDFHDAIRAFLTLDPAALTAATPAIFDYYREHMTLVGGDDVADWYVRIDGPATVLDHVQLGTEPMVSRDLVGERLVYVSLECECEWEPEHGLQIVFREGRTVTKVGPYDGHLT